MSDVNPIRFARREDEARCMSTENDKIDGPTGKPSQAEGADPDQPKGSQASEPLPAEGHPSPADGGELDE
jgi:hypothetical protein